MRRSGSRYYSPLRAVQGYFFTRKGTVPDCKFPCQTSAPSLTTQSYATFVAATIHVRIAAQRARSSEANHLLQTCIEGLSENSATNPGVMKMYQSVSGLMTKLGVTTLHDNHSTSSMSVPDDRNNQTQASLDDALDIDAIIR